MAQGNILYGELNTAITNLGSQAANVNAGGGIIVWRTIPGQMDTTDNARLFGWHPIIFEAQNWYFQNGSFTPPAGAATRTRNTYTAYNATDIVQSVSLEIYKEDGTTLIAELKAETHNGKAVFDVSAYIRTLFADDMQDYDYENYYEADKMLAAMFKTHLSINSSNAQIYVVQNAVSQIGSDGEKGFSSNVFPQDNKRIVLWSTDDDAAPTVTVLFRTNTTIDSVLYEAGHAYNFPIASEESWNALDSALSLADAGFTFVDATLSDNQLSERCGATAIRWLNRKGGIEYYVFSKGLSKTKTANTKTLRAVQGDNYKQLRTNVRAVSVDGERKVTMRADGISYDDLDLLTKMPYSPHIQWYDADNDLWVECSVSSFSNEEANPLHMRRVSSVLTQNANLYSFEITLRCPNINMQFE